MAVAGIRLDDGTGGFATNSFPVRTLKKKIEEGSGAWLEAHRAEQRRRFKAVLCAKPREFDAIRKERKRAEKEGTNIIPPTVIANVEDEDKILDGFFLMKHCCVEDPSDLCSVKIDNQNLSDVKEEDFQLFDNVAYVNAAENLLSLESFKHFPIIRELELGLNALRGIHLQPGDFPCLEMLDLSYNNLSSDDILTVGLIPKLRVLHLTGNGFTKLPTEMSRPHIEVLPEGTRKISRFTKLEILLLDDNRFEDVNIFAALAGLKNLKHLNLSKNLLRSVPQLMLVEGRHVTKDPDEFHRMLKPPKSARSARSGRQSARTPHSSRGVKAKALNGLMVDNTNKEASTFLTQNTGELSANAGFFFDKTDTSNGLVKDFTQATQDSLISIDHTMPTEFTATSGAGAQNTSSSLADLYSAQKMDVTADRGTIIVPSSNPTPEAAEHEQTNTSSKNGEAMSNHEEVVSNYEEVGSNYEEMTSNQQEVTSVKEEGTTSFRDDASSVQGEQSGTKDSDAALSGTGYSYPGGAESIMGEAAEFSMAGEAQAEESPGRMESIPSEAQAQESPGRMESIPSEAKALSGSMESLMEALKKHEEATPIPAEHEFGELNLEKLDEEVSQQVDKELAEQAASQHRDGAAESTFQEYPDDTEEDLPPPFPELSFLDLSNNLIQEEEALLAVAAWPGLSELMIIGNPLVKTRSGDPPLLKRYLMKRLGIHIQRKEQKAPTKPQIEVPNRPRRKIKTKIYPVPRCNVDELLALEAPPPMTASSITSSAREEPPALESKLIILGPKSLTPLPPIGQGGTTLSDALQEEDEDDADDEGDDDDDASYYRETSSASTDYDPRVKQPAFFMTETEGVDEARAMSASSAGFESNVGTHNNRSSSQSQEKPVNGRYRGYEELLDIDEEVLDKDIPMPKDVIGNVQALKYALSHPLIFRDNYVNLYQPQNKFSPWTRSKYAPAPPVKTKAEKAVDLLDTIKNRQTYSEVPLADYMNKKKSKKETAKTQKLINDLGKMYQKVTIDVFTEPQLTAEDTKKVQPAKTRNWSKFRNAMKINRYMRQFKKNTTKSEPAP